MTARPVRVPVTELLLRCLPNTDDFNLEIQRLSGERVIRVHINIESTDF